MVHIALITLKKTKVAHWNWDSPRIRSHKVDTESSLITRRFTVMSAMYNKFFKAKTAFRLSAGSIDCARLMSWMNPPNCITTILCGLKSSTMFPNAVKASAFNKQMKNLLSVHSFTNGYIQEVVWQIPYGATIGCCLIQNTWKSQVKFTLSRPVESHVEINFQHSKVLNQTSIYY